MNEWAVFLRRISRFTWRVVTNVRLLLYFLLAICVFGGLGAWIPAGQLWFGVAGATALSVQRNLATYVIGIAVTALADCIVRNRNDDVGAFRLFVLGLTVFAAILAIVVLWISDPQKAQHYSMAGAVLAGVVWLMVNDSHPDLTESNAYSAIGGENPK
jgi:peptidoglycan/LPS O-acetylase OafA/YrhL